MTWYSQAGQDRWVVDQLADTPHGGYFVDVGAHDGVVHSNTFALELAGWLGICIEPERGAYDALRRNRSAICVRTAASDHDGSCLFDGVRIVTAVAEHVECFTLETLLEEAEAPDVIDYLSIDVEGHELQVLDGMDFARWHVRLITIEHNLYSDGPARKNAIHERLTAAGFDRVVEDVVAPGYGPYEDWYRNTAG